MAPAQGLCRYGLEFFKTTFQSNKTIEEPNNVSLVEYTLNLCMVLVLSREHVDQPFRDLHNGTCNIKAGQ